MTMAQTTPTYTITKADGRYWLAGTAGRVAGRFCDVPAFEQPFRTRREAVAEMRRMQDLAR